MTKQYMYLFAAAAATALLLGSYTTARAETREIAPSFHIDCQNGYKFGDQPGVIIRGWSCQYHGLRDPNSSAAQTRTMGAALDHGMTPAASN